MPGFTMVSNALESADLDPYQFRMLVHIMRVGNSWEGVRTLADKCKMSKSKAATTKDWLLDNDWIVWVKTKDGHIAVTAANPLPCDRPPHGQVQQNRPPDGQSVHLMDTNRPPDGQERPPHGHKHTNEALPNEAYEYVPPQEYPDLETENKRADMLTAISTQVKETVWPGTQNDFDAAAIALLEIPTTPETVKGFLPWWKKNGFYSGKPALTSFMKEFNSYLDSLTPSPNGQHAPAPNREGMILEDETGRYIIKDGRPERIEDATDT